MLATTDAMRRRRLAVSRRMAWSLGGQKKTDARRLEQPQAGARAEEDPRRRLDELDEQIGNQHDRIAALMRMRNEQPEDAEIPARLQKAFEGLRVLQNERADRMSKYFRPRFPLPSEEDSELVRKARKILEHYEGASTGDLASDGSLRPKP